MAKTLIREIRPYVKLYRDPKTGIAWIENGSTGTATSIHPNIASSGSVAGMKKRGYWGTNDRTVKSHGFIYNIDIPLPIRDDDDRAVLNTCNCGGAHERKSGATSRAYQRPASKLSPALSRLRKKHRHDLACLEAGSSGLLICKITGEHGGYKA